MGRQLCKLNGVGVKRRLREEVVGRRLRRRRMGLVVFCMGWGESLKRGGKREADLGERRAHHAGRW